MASTTTQIPNEAALGGRAIGAMFFSVFGGAWIALGAYRARMATKPVLSLIIFITLAILVFAYLRYRRFQPAMAADAETPEKKKRDRWFHLINAGQWIVILIVGNILANIGHGDWVIPAAIFVVGLHFLPLARLFANPWHYFTGAALLAVAVFYPLVTPEGAKSAIGCLGAGSILWLSALWAVLVNL